MRNRWGNGSCRHKASNPASVASRSSQMVRSWTRTPSAASRLQRARLPRLLPTTRAAPCHWAAAGGARIERHVDRPHHESLAEEVLLEVFEIFRRGLGRDLRRRRSASATAAFPAEVSSFRNGGLRQTLPPPQWPCLTGALSEPATAAATGKASRVRSSVGVASKDPAARQRAGPSSMLAIPSRLQVGVQLHQLARIAGLVETSSAQTSSLRPAARTGQPGSPACPGRGRLPRFGTGRGGIDASAGRFRHRSPPLTGAGEPGRHRSAGWENRPR